MKNVTEVIRSFGGNALVIVMTFLTFFIAPCIFRGAFVFAQNSIEDQTKRLNDNTSQSRNLAGERAGEVKTVSTWIRIAIV